MLLKPAASPKKELLLLVVFLPALNPKNEFELPVVLAKPALCPKNAFALPVALLAPASFPANKLFVPALLKMRCPPRLNCVAASKTFAVPVPPMLKLVEDCWLVPF